MKFYLHPAPTFTTDIPLTVPEGVTQVSFTFVYKDKDALDEWVKQNKTKATVEALLEVVKEWGVLSETDEPVAVNLENMKTLSKKYPNAMTEIFRGYYKAIAESRVKN